MFENNNSGYSLVKKEIKTPQRNLYKVKVEVDVFVMADGSEEAIKTGKENASSEIEEFATAKAMIIKKETEIPKSWIDAIPYTPYGALDENKTCKQLINEIISKAEENNINQNELKSNPKPSKDKNKKDEKAKFTNKSNNINKEHNIQSNQQLNKQPKLRFLN